MQSAIDQARRGIVGGYFWLERKEDESGVSGVGKVAEGFEFWDGTCAIRWIADVRCSAFYNSIDELEHIHGHSGKTVIRRLPAPPIKGMHDD